jgi:hypothetical protein
MCEDVVLSSTDNFQYMDKDMDKDKDMDTDVDKAI